MTDKLRDAAQQALEVLEQLQGGCTDSDDGTVEAITIWCPEVIDAIRAALAEQTEQEPTPDWISYNKHSDVLTIRGRRYDAALFDERGFGSPPGTLLRIVDGPADVVTLERVAEQTAEQEPVAYMLPRDGGDCAVFREPSSFATRYSPKGWIPLYTAPQPAAPTPPAQQGPRRLPTLPFAVFDEFGKGCEDRIDDYFSAALAQQDAQQKHKPLFAEMIAQHPGLAEELAQQDVQTCVGCNGIGMVGNILDTVTCPFCDGSGTAAPTPPAQSQTPCDDTRMLRALLDAHEAREYGLLDETAYSGLIDALKKRLGESK